MLLMKELRAVEMVSREEQILTWAELWRAGPPVLARALLPCASRRPLHGSSRQLQKTNVPEGASDPQTPFYTPEHAVFCSIA